MRLPETTNTYQRHADEGSAERLRRKAEALESENAEIRADLGLPERTESERDALVIVRTGIPKESYRDRTGRGESPIEFFERVYGGPARMGLIGSHHIRRADPRFADDLGTFLAKRGMKTGDFVRTRERYYRDLVENLGETRANEIFNAVRSLRRRGGEGDSARFTRRYPKIPDGKSPDRWTAAKIFFYEEENSRLLCLQEEVPPPELEREVLEMLEAGRPKERYADRKDKKEDVFTFFRRNYRRLAEANALYLHQLRRLDPEFTQLFAVECGRKGRTASQYLRSKHERVEYVVELVGESYAMEVHNAVKAARANALVAKREKEAA